MKTAALVLGIIGTGLGIITLTWNVISYFMERRFKRRADIVLVPGYGM